MGSVVLEFNYIGAATYFYGHRERRQLPCPSLSTRELNRAAILGQAHSPFCIVDSRAEQRSDFGPGPFSIPHCRWARPLQAVIDELLPISGRQLYTLVSGGALRY